MIKFIAGLAFGLTISAAIAQVPVLVPSIMYGQKIFSPVIDCGSTNKATLIVERRQAPQPLERLSAH